MVNFLFSFLLPFLAVIAGLALRGAMPFGDGSLLAIDAWGQYYPMLCAMKEVVKSGELFWSYKGLLGFNLWAQNAYYTNSILWLPLYLLPDKLMIAGINILAAIRIGLAALSYTIISNFYIGYMVCLFSVVYFAGCVIGEKLPLRQLWEKVLRFLLYSLIAGAISAVYTLPAYYAIRNTAASEAGFGGKIEFYHPVTEVLVGFLPFQKISLVYEVPNIYCGALCILLCILFFFIQKNIRKRICIISGCIFFYLSLNCNIFDYVWHGFHYPNQLPGRWSFCLIFLIVKQAYVCCGDLEKLRREKNGAWDVKKQQKPARAGHRLHSRFSLCGVIVMLSTRYDKSCAADVFLGVKYRINNDKDGAGYTKNEAALPVGYSIKAESCEKFVKLLNDKSADYGTVKNFIDENVLGKMYDISVGTGWHGLAGKNEYISGNIMTRSGILVISLPYNEGWSIYIDGVKQRTESLAGYMLMTNIENGNHLIEMKHRTKGLGAGAVISILAIAGVGVYYRKRN